MSEIQPTGQHLDPESHVVYLEPAKRGKKVREFIIKLVSGREVFRGRLVEDDFPDAGWLIGVQSQDLPEGTPRTLYDYSDPSIDHDTDEGDAAKKRMILRVVGVGAVFLGALAAEEYVRHKVKNSNN